jgi:hypothetical protein
VLRLIPFLALAILPGGSVVHTPLPLPPPPPPPLLTCALPTAVHRCRCQVRAMDAAVPFPAQAGGVADDFACSRAACHYASRAAAAAGQAPAAVRHDLFPLYVL